MFIPEKFNNKYKIKKKIKLTDNLYSSLFSVFSQCFFLSVCLHKNFSLKNVLYTINRMG